MRRRHSLALGLGLALVAVAVLVVGGVRWARQDPHVAMVGDSLLYDVEDELHDGLQRWRATVSAIPGTTIGRQVPEARRLAATHPQAMVIVLGANNILDGVDDDDATEIDQLLDAVRGVPCVRWLDVADSTQRPMFNATAKELDDLIEAKAASHGNVTIVDWAATARSHPEWFNPGDIHLVQAGQVAMAREITRSLDGC